MSPEKIASYEPRAVKSVIKALHGEVEGDTNREEDERDNCERFLVRACPYYIYLNSVCWHELVPLVLFANPLEMRRLFIWSGK